MLSILAGLFLLWGLYALRTRQEELLVCFSWLPRGFPTVRTSFTLIWGFGDSHTLRDGVSSHPTPGNFSFSQETVFFFLPRA